MEETAIPISSRAPHSRADFFWGFLFLLPRMVAPPQGGAPSHWSTAAATAAAAAASAAKPSPTKAPAADAVSNKHCLLEGPPTYGIAHTWGALVSSLLTGPASTPLSDCLELPSAYPNPHALPHHQQQQQQQEQEQQQQQQQQQQQRVSVLLRRDRGGKMKTKLRRTERRRRRQEALNRRIGGLSPYQSTTQPNQQQGPPKVGAPLELGDVVIVP
ncbi:hypothetical protein ACSSS7_004855 [Eimeria intestinalis]